jgi:hypothetical protein
MMLKLFFARPLLSLEQQQPQQLLQLPSCSAFGLVLHLMEWREPVEM